jgi:surface antigen
VTLSGITTTSGSVSVGGTVASQEAITTVTLRAAADGVISDKSFTVTIQNPCQRIILQGSTPSPLVGMTLIRDFDSTKT